MASEPDKPGGLREEWMAVVLVAIIVLFVAGFQLPWPGKNRRDTLRLV